MPIPQKDGCHSDPGCCDQSIERRSFLALSGLTAAGALLGGRDAPIMAGPFEDENAYRQAIPIDKKLDPAWVASLAARGEKETYSDPVSLRHIGMPVGGTFAGTVYLSGDGQLWLWDIFNRDQTAILPREVAMESGFSGSPLMGGLNYVDPAPLTTPFDLHFELIFDRKTRSLDSTGFNDVTFDGRYPIGRVTYRDKELPVEVTLEAFSPFIPLDVDNSSLPATVMEYTIRNESESTISVALSGHIENPVCRETGELSSGRLKNRVVKDDRLTAIECSAEPVRPHGSKHRPDIVFERFEKPTYEGWTVDGTAFGDGTVHKNDIPDYQGDVAGVGDRVVNSHASAPGDQVAEKDSHIGTLTSQTFTIERRFIRFLIGGGAHKGDTCVNLLIGKEVVASATGRNNNRMQPNALRVDEYEGKEAQIQIVDRGRGGWGNVGVDEIVFTDKPLDTRKLTEQRDFGTMTIAVVGKPSQIDAIADRASKKDAAVDSDLGSPPTGMLSRSVEISPGETETVTFLVTWNFPNFYGRGVGEKRVGHEYAARFKSAIEVARYVADNYDHLAGTTRRWVDTWYDSSLPYWFLDRTMANTSTLATTTCYRFADGRFWAWEGIGCCHGTCTHVWHYAQALGRLFPQIEREQRENVDFGIALHDDGGIGMRAGLNGANEPAHDGQCGRILGAYREHQMSPDDAFLRKTWPNIKLAIEYLIRKDENADGMIEGSQPNTLDAAWYGKVSFLASLYLATLKAGEAMAREMGDLAFATKCELIAARGEASILETYNGEFFTQIEDKTQSKAIGIGPGCYIDQIFGQTWAHWLGLGPLFSRDNQLSALRALWKYNFVPDVGPFRKKFPRGRWYAMAGDAGLLMCTWPNGGQNAGFRDHWQYMYFNECMSGFEWQAAAHMIAEGIDQPDLLQNGLAVARSIHDRYNAALRNPYNEIECSDHYARAMASYGAYLAACGFICHGPNGEIGFVPRLTPEDFKCAFTAAEGWGSFHQRRDGDSMRFAIELKWGTLRLRSLILSLPSYENPPTITAQLGGMPLDAVLDASRDQPVITFAKAITIEEGQSLEIAIG